MPRTGYGNAEGENILCPFYKRVTQNEIWCESHVPEASAAVIHYRHKEDCEKQRRLYCEGNYKRCEHYICVMHMKWQD